MSGTVKYVRVKRPRAVDPVDSLVIARDGGSLESGLRGMDLDEGESKARNSSGVVYKLVATLPTVESDGGKRSRVEHTDAYHAEQLRNMVKLGDEKVQFIDVSFGSQHSGSTKKEGMNSLDAIYGGGMRQEQEQGKMYYTSNKNNNDNFLDESTMEFLNMMMQTARAELDSETSMYDKEHSAFHQLKKLQRKDEEDAQQYDVYAVYEEALDAFEMKKLQYAHVLDLGQLHYQFKEEDDGMLVHELIEPNDVEHSDVDSLEYDYEDEPSSGAEHEFDNDDEASDDYGRGYGDYDWSGED